jgi:hypothetical protein
MAQTYLDTLNANWAKAGAAIADAARSASRVPA